MTISVKHECSAVGVDQKVVVYQTASTDPCFLLVGDVVVLVSNCPRCDLFVGPR